MSGSFGDSSYTLGDLWSGIKDDFGSLSGATAAHKQQQAAQQALAQQQGVFNSQQAANMGAVGAANGFLQSGTDSAANALNAGAGNALGAIQTGTRNAAGALVGGDNGAQNLLGNVEQMANFVPGATTAIGSANVYGGQLGQLLGQPGGLYGSFQQDPGYQFQQQQGEQAINRAASAAGGRFSPRTAEQLAQFNNGLANQSFNNYAQRQQGLAGLLGGLNENQAGRQDQAQLAAQANQMGLAGMGMNAFGQGAGLESQLGQNLGSLFAGAGNTNAGIYGSTGSALANLLYGSGAAMGGNEMQGAGMGTQLAGAMMGAYNNPVQYAGGQDAAYANLGQQGLGLLTASAGKH